MHAHKDKRKSRALVLVLGELARSPRMQYHCVSLAKNDYEVTVIANSGGDKCCEDLEINQDIKQKFMPNPPKTFSSYLLKPIWQALWIMWTLLHLINNLPDIILVQNPPSIPTLPIIVLFSKIIRAKLIVDWHNYGYSILALKLGNQHKLVRLSKWIEFVFGRFADGGFCVSKSMQKDLMDNHNIKYQLQVLYDRPPGHFKPMTVRNKHKFFYKIKKTIKEFRSPFDDMSSDELARSPSPNDARGTRFTMHESFDKGLIMTRPHRPAIIMSSTSWTEDEDFDMFLDALKLYDSARSMQLQDKIYQENNDQLRLPELVCVITGKGPLKEMYERKIQASHMRHIQIVLPWLTSKDYPKMVGSADLGICLHKSSSGVDLPMKVVDMFGCSIPVLAFHYEAINELVLENFYGMTFNDQYDLFQKMVILLKDFNREDSGGGSISSRGDSTSNLLSEFRKNISRHFLVSRWEDNWNREAKPLLRV